MLKGEIINGYRILEDFKVAGGMSKISFAEKGGKTYFIKEFLSPKYPTPESPGSEKTKEKKRKACVEFEKHHRDLNNAIGKCCAGTGGNLIYAIDFFRNGASYYKVTEKIDISTLPCESISRLPLEKILLIAKSAVHSIKILHGLKIVHGDLKLDNLPIKEAMRGYVVKLIDFDDSYFESNPPSDRENLVGTPEYYSPEQASYIMDEDEEIAGESLTCKSDIFTLGIIFSEYFSGGKPILSRPHKNTWSCVKDGKSFNFRKALPVKIDNLIRSMLALNPNERPTISEVFNILKDIKPEDDFIEIKIERAKRPRPILRFGPGFKPIESEGLVSEAMGEKTVSSVDGSSALFEDKPKTSGRLRGSGLEIADR